MTDLADTAPFDVPAGGPATAPLNVVDDGSGDDSGGLDVIVERLSGRFDRIMWDCNGHVLAALAAVSDPAIRDGFRAVGVCAELDARHQPVPWPPPSAVVVCSCGHGSFDHCPDRAILDRLRQP